MTQMLTTLACTLLALLALYLCMQWDRPCGRLSEQGKWTAAVACHRP